LPVYLAALDRTEPSLSLPRTTRKKAAVAVAEVQLRQHPLSVAVLSRAAAAAAQAGTTTLPRRWSLLPPAEHRTRTRLELAARLARTARPLLAQQALMVTRRAAVLAEVVVGLL